MTKTLTLALLALAPLVRADYDVLFDATATKGDSVNVAHLEGPLSQVSNSETFYFSNGNPEVEIALSLGGPRRLQVDAVFPTTSSSGWASTPTASRAASSTARRCG